MNIKRYYFIVLIFLVLISISAASAANEQTSDIISANDNAELILDETNMEDVSSANDNQNDELILKDSKPSLANNMNQEPTAEEEVGNFTSLEEKINAANDGDTITLDCNYEYEGEGYTGGIGIDKAITIDGQGYQIDAKSQARIFKIGNTVTLKNITFINGYNFMGGGAILWQALDGVLSDCRFINNTAFMGGGGAISWEAWDGTIKNCYFTANHASDGAAIKLSTAEYTSISNCTFIDNNKTIGGVGAIYCSQSTSPITNCTFINNERAIYFDFTGGSVSDCLFLNNSKAIEIYPHFNKAITVSNNVLLNNSENIEILSSSFESKDIIIDNWFGSNESNYLDKPDSNSTSWLFLNGTANPNPVYCSNPTEIIFKFFKYNESSGEIQEYTKDLYPINLTITATGGDVDKNVSKIGETIEFTPNAVGTATVTASIENVAQTVEIEVKQKGDFDLLQDMINNESLSVIDLDRNYTYNEFDTITEGVIINRTLTINGNGYTIDAKGKSRIFKVEADNVIFKNITFANGYITDSYGRGGAIYLHGNYGLVDNCSFINNIAYYDGAITLWGNNNSLFNSHFVNNSALKYDGVGIIQGDGFTVFNCSFINNTAETYCGTLNIYTINGTVIDCSFINNTAKTAAGAIYSSGNVKILECTFINNTAASRGGAIEAFGNDFNISSCKFINNTAGYGTVYVNTYYGQSSDFTINHNIFLNNNAVDIVFPHPEESSNVDYNWFGNNATNYDTAPITNNTNMTCWLFLNATDCPDIIPLSSSFSTTFKLYAYNKLTQEVSEYDNSLLMPVNLTITPTKGEADENVNIGEDIEYTATSIGKGTITASIENAEYTIEFLIKEDPELKVNSQETTYGDTTIISLDYKPAATGTVNISLKGKDGNEYAFTNIALNDSITLTETINADEYEVNVTYSGDDDFLDATATGTLTVNKANSTLTVSDIEFDYDSTGSSKISFTGATGVDAKIIDHDEATIDINDTSISVSNLNAGNYTLEVTTIPDANHNAVEKTVNITVHKVDSTLEVPAISFDYGESGSTEATFTGATGIEATVNDPNVVVKIDGSNITVSNLSPGNYTLTVTTIPDANHNKVTETADITVNKLESELNATEITAIWGSDDYLVATLKDSNGKAISGAILSVDLDGAGNYTTDSDGTIKVPIKDLDVGNYTAKITFAGDRIYIESNAMATVIINKDSSQITASNLNTSYQKDDYLIATLTDSKGNPLVGEKVSVDLNGITEYTTDSNGQIKIPTKDLAADNYNATISFEGNDHYIGSDCSTKVNVERKGTKFNFTNMKTTAINHIIDGRNGKYFIFQLLDDEGNPVAGKKVSIGFNEKVYNRTTDSEGKAKLQINLGRAFNYTFAISFLGDENYSGAFDTALIEVVAQTPKLTTSAKTYKATAKTKSLSATFKTSRGNAVSGKKIKFTVNGKTYTAKTNKNGVATVKVSLNKKGTYKFTAKFAGDNTYKAVSKSSKVTIK